jgi:signal transduction histidine kinase
MALFKIKFESKIHLGFLVIVCLLLSLNFVTNYMVYKARKTSGEQLAYDFGRAGRAVSRAVHQHYPEPMPETEQSAILARYDLGAMELIPSRPSDFAEGPRRKWFAEAARSLPPSHLPEMAEKLLLADYEQVTRGRGDEYFWVHPLSEGEKGMVILSMRRPDLAYLDDSRILLTYLLPGALLVILGVYALLVRRIFYPFRKIRQQAELVGRSVDKAKDEAEAVVEEYRQVIERLRQKEVELLKLNARIQQKADKLEQLNQYVLSSSQTGVVTLDTGGLVLDCNESARDMLMLHEARYAGANYHELFSSYPDLVVRIADAIRRREFGSYRELSLIRPDETELILGVTVSPITDHTASLVGVSVLLNDSTEVSRLRRELEQSTRMVALGEMAGGLAHQLRNSIGAIRGFGNLVRKRLAASDLPLVNVEALLLETQQAEQLVSLFLSFAKPFQLEIEPIDVRSFLEELIRTFEVRKECASARFNLAFEGDQSVEGDATLLKQAFCNVIDNAIQAYPDNDGTVEISSTEATGGIHVDIVDHGSGIEADQLDNVFTPFFSSRPSGSGLGLPLARKIIEVHSGRITATSEPGAGTRFRIFLPTHQIREDSSQFVRAFTSA